MLKHYFIASTTCAAETWKRLVLRYQQFPWKLAQVSDTRLSDQERLRTAVEFKESSPCCLDMFSRKVREALPLDEPFSHTYQDFLAVFCAGKVTNITVEDGFARASSMRAYMRGQVHKCPTMCSKHMLAEIKAIHRKCTELHAASADYMVLDRWRALEDSQHQSSSGFSRSDSQLTSDGSQHSSSSSQLVCAAQFSSTIVRHNMPDNKATQSGLDGCDHHAAKKGTGKGGTNAWTLFRKKSFASMVRGPLESKKDFQRRCWTAAKEGFSALKQTNPSVVAHMSEQAKEHNQVRTNQAKQPIQGKQMQHAHPLAAEVLEELVSNTPGFVKVNSSEWRARHSEAVSVPQGTIAAVADPFCQSFCKRSFNENVLAKYDLYRQALRSYVRRFSKMKLRGQHIIVVTAPRSAHGVSAGSEVWETAFYVCNAMFKPFDMACWKCTIVQRIPHLAPCLSLCYTCDCGFLVASKGGN